MQAALAQQIKQAAKNIQDHGYTVIKNFITPQSCQAAIN